ncbi:MAG TPA: 6-phosphogluconolactonase [Verrucomicrobiae bacterium]|nr:6-phosphogluconolactonase [Verrucomicrobiae bacterium]
MPRGELQICRDAGGVAAALADYFVDIGCTAITDRGVFHVALSGGNTPRAAFSLLAREPRAIELTWKDVCIFFGDERCVGPEDPQSNYRMAEETFLREVPVLPENVHRMRGEIDPAQAAAEYAQTLRGTLGDPPRFDLVLLGMGPDGHTASLFPGSPPNEDDDALVRAVYAKSQMMWRITVTPKVINSARNVIFAIEGSEKAQVFAAVYNGPFEPSTYPSQIVDPTDGRLIYLVDELAAGVVTGAAEAH